MKQPRIDDLNAILEAAQKFVDFCDGLEDAGLVAYAQRGRRLANETIRLAYELKTLRPQVLKLLSWRNSLLICGNAKCRRLVVTAGDEGEVARVTFAEGDADGTTH